MDKGRVVEAGEVAEMTRGDGLALRVQVEGGAAPLHAALSGAGYEVAPESDDSLRVKLGAGSEDADGVFAVAAGIGAVITGLEPERRAPGPGPWTFAS